MRTRRIVFAGALGALAPWVARAHPGHGIGDGWSLLHWVAEPLHGGAAILLALGLFGAFAWLRRASGPR
jgi:hypothetical protein